ncbi:helix-turn-helix domain-containing protein [Clostridium porci]|nr:helix-turn-helix transcriptional regulator [Clostridium porci]
METHKNERLVSVMEAKGIRQSALSKMTKIPPMTLIRIINGHILRVKMSHKQAIAQALGVSIHAIFDAPTDVPSAAPIRSEEAGFTIVKQLTADESMLLYWYQNMDIAARFELYDQARVSYIHTQAEVLARASNVAISTDEPQQYEQLSFDV